MKSKLELIPTGEMNREEWLNYRHTGIGASEVGAIMGLDDYTSSLELYYYKIGEVPKFDTESLASFLGREQEDLIARLWQYWDGDEAGMIRNFRAGNMVRKCQRVNAFVRNPDYPWLYVSLDRRINRIKGKGEGSLELKTISGYEADKWDAGLPPKYVTQLATQVGVCEFDFGEMALLQDGRRFDVLPFENSPSIWNHVVTRTQDFWNRVVQGRKWVNEKYDAMINFNQKRVDELTAEIDRLAPEPDGTLAYADYLAKRFQKPTTLERKGTQEDLIAAQEHIKATAQLKDITELKTLQENILKRSIGDTCQVLDFGTSGKVYWNKSDNGRRYFRNKVRE